MTVNLPLLREAVAWATQEAALPVAKRTWFQGEWAAPGREVGRGCGTVYCIAGYIVFHNGFEPYGKYSSKVHNPETGVEGYIPYIAQQLLGISDRDAWKLFAGENTLADIRSIARQIADREGETL